MILSYSSELKITLIDAIPCIKKNIVARNLILKFEPQLIVGILFLVIGGMDINKKPSQRTADILNNVIVVLIFLITLVNVIINGNILIVNVTLHA